MSDLQVNPRADAEQGHAQQIRPWTVRVGVFVAVALPAVAIDQVTKALAVRHLADSPGIEIIPRVLSLRLLYNPGATLGMGSGATPMISLLAVIACIAVFVLAMRTTSLRWVAALALAFAGALGNLIDRVVRARQLLDGSVVDFLDYGWSVGNVADIILGVAAVGIILLLLNSVPFDTRNE